MPNSVRSSDPQLDLQATNSATSEALDSQVLKAHEQLIELKRKQDLIERQKRELEELSRAQEKLTRDRNEVVEKLRRAKSLAESEGMEAQRRLEMLQGVYESVTAQLARVEALDPKSWDGPELAGQLAGGAATVEEAEAEFFRNYPRILPNSAEAAEAGLPGMSGGGRDFGYWLRAGAAFTLPLTALGFIALLVFILR